ncbi:MAG: hypothetical protein ICV83_13830 [Cytophagales bacterium]|nr:hypothetical protein [Cytophagales bacterium]
MTTNTIYGRSYGTGNPGSIQPYPEPKTEQHNMLYAMVQFGAKLGFAWIR